MSEHQHYEWQTIDRLLTEDEQAAVGKLSSHIEVGPSQAVVTYDWSDFGHDPRQVLARYFDAHLYYANWGARELMFRFPAGLLDKAALKPYLIEDMIQLSAAGKAVILEFRIEEDDGRDIFEAELSGLVSLRNDILAGDYRCLYLGWLKGLSWSGGDEEDELAEPPVPAGLGKLTPALRRFAEFLDLDIHLIQSAATASPAQSEAGSDAALRQALGQLSAEERDDYLWRLLQGEAALGITLRHRLQSELKEPARPAGGGRTAGELLAGAERAKRQDDKRKAAAAEKHRIAELQKLAQTEEKAWQTVDEQLAGRQWTAHDRAVEQLQQLRELADYQQTRADFDRRLAQLRAQYQSRPSIMKRLEEAGLR